MFRQHEIEASNVILDIWEKLRNKMKGINQTKNIENYNSAWSPRKLKSIGEQNGLVTQEGHMCKNACKISKEHIGQGPTSNSYPGNVKHGL